MVTPPVLPSPPGEYNIRYFDGLLNTLRLYFNNLNARSSVQALSLNFDLDKLPTEADIGTLRVGDVYRDTTAGNVLKVKV